MYSLKTYDIPYNIVATATIYLYFFFLLFLLLSKVRLQRIIVLIEVSKCLELNMGLQILIKVG